MLYKIMMMGCLLLAAGGCKKYLDQKPDKSLVIPGSVTDVQALLDNYGKVNEGDPAGGEISADNYYLSDADFDAFAQGDMGRLYTWEPDHVFASIYNMWHIAYQAVYVPNVVLDALPAIQRTADNAAAWDNAKGAALYYRAREFHLIAATWALAYDSATAGTEPGIPLRLSSDFNTVSTRGDLETTYARIIEDLQEAARLLPLRAVNVERPSRPAAYAMLARVYLSMRKYSLAGNYADSCLQLSNTLLDFNTIDALATDPLTRFNPEILVYSIANDWGPLNNSVAKIDSALYDSYESNDLRKTIFFQENPDGTHGLKGNYSGTAYAELTGPATDEMYLVRAESMARQDNVAAAMADLNSLLAKRWKTGTWVPFTAASPAVALQLVLEERRKELLYRELRWMDIKRLNREGAGITLTRKVQGKVYTLPPNDPRYALPLPEDVIRLTGMEQNPR